VSFSTQSIRLRALLALATVLTCVGGAQARAQEGGKILFWSGRSGHPGLWMMNADGSHQRLLSRFPQNAKRGVLSPDGRLLAFDGAAAGVRAMTNFDIQVMAMDGSNRVRLTSSPAAELDAQWSPNGRLLSYTRQLDTSGDQVSIWTIRPDGSRNRRLTTGSLARWSRDGRRLLFDRHEASFSNLYVYTLDTGQAKPITQGDVAEPGGWSPDGAHIVFMRQDRNGHSTIHVADADGSHVRRLTDGAADATAASFSPDGRHIVFTSNRNGHDQVFVMRSDGAGMRNLSRSTSDDEAVQWHA
jgi:Tol biopolymer transport system component